MKKILLLTFLTSTACASTACYVSAQTTKPKSGATGAATTAAPAEDKEKKAEFVDKLFTEQSYLNAQIADKLFTFKFSPSCWTAFNAPNGNPNETGLGLMRDLSRAVVQYAKREQLGDLMALAVDDKKVEKENRPMLDEVIKKIREKFSLVVEAGVDCKGKAPEMLLRYPYETMTRVGPTNPEWSPTGGEAHMTTVMSTTANDISVKISPDGKQFTITGPAYTEAYDTQSKIAKGLDRANKNR